MTNAAVYYFSGTGNSYTVATDIADEINAEVKSIPAAMRSETVEISADVLGIVFPDYHSSLPNIIKRFIHKIGTLDGKYIFGVCTYSGKGPGLTIRYLKQLIESKSRRLAAGFAVQMPYNYIIPSFNDLAIRVTLKNVPVEEQKKMFSAWNKKRETITDFVTNRKEGIYETSAEFLLTFIEFSKLKDIVGKRIWLKMAGYSGHTPPSFSESWKVMDHGFHANDDCISCRTCVEICPVDNIVLIEGKPSWQHHCEQCFACLQWCPQSAIQFGEHTESDTRYHHPDVTASDLMI